MNMLKGLKMGINKLPHITKSEYTEVQELLKIGDMISVNLTSLLSAENFKVMSISRDSNEVIIIACKSNKTLMVEMTSSTTNATLLGETVGAYEFVDVYTGYSKVELSGTRQPVYATKQLVPVERPLKAGDVISTPRKKFEVEYITSDGSIVAVCVGRSQPKMTKKTIFITRNDEAVIKSIHEKLTWK